MRKNLIWIGVFTGLFLLIGTIITFNSLYATELNHTKTLEAAQVNKVNIRTELLDVKLYTSKDDNIHASISGYASKLSSYDIHMEMEQDTLNIRSLETNAVATSVSFSRTVTLQIYLPQSMLDDISIYTTFGSLYADEMINSGLLTFKSSLGGVYLQKYQGKNIVVDSGLGNIQIDQLSGQAHLNTSSGNISITHWNASGENNLIHTNKGNIHISLAQPILPLQLNLFTNGNLSTNLDIQHIPFADRFKSTGLNRIYGTTESVSQTSTYMQVSSDTGQIILQ